MDLRVSATAARLAEAGMGEGSRVALYLPKDERYFVLLLALLRNGCVACPVSTRLPPDGLAPLLRRAGCAALVAEDDPLPVASHPGPPVLRPEALLEGPTARYRLRTPVPLALDRPATIVFTSGSTGAPKAALHTLGNHHFSALGSNANIPLSAWRAATGGDRWLHTLPLYHVGGLSVVFRCLLAGAAVVLPEPGVPLGEAIAKSGATHVSLVATQLRRLLKEDAPLGGPLGSLKAVLLGGGPVPVSLVEAAAARGLPVHTSYGLTEMASQVTTTLPPGAPGAASDDLRTSGRVLPHREVSVSECGEVLVRGRTLFAGYVEGDAVERPFDPDGWFHTKDLGELDAGGRLILRGRLDNMFVSGGENVQPEEVEDALTRIGGVEEAVVVPVPDEEFGERPVAFVKADGPAPRDLASALETVLPRFKIPTHFYPWPAPPGPAPMKVDRAFFRREALRRREET